MAKYIDSGSPVPPSTVAVLLWILATASGFALLGSATHRFGGFIFCAVFQAALLFRWNRPLWRPWLIGTLFVGISGSWFSFFFSFFGYQTLPRIIAVTLGGAMSGASVGLGGALALRVVNAPGLRWVFISTVAWSLGCGAAYTALHLLDPHGAALISWLTAAGVSESMASWIVAARSGALTGLIAGTLSAIGAVALVRRQDTGAVSSANSQAHELPQEGPLMESAPEEGRADATALAPARRTLAWDSVFTDWLARTLIRGFAGAIGSIGVNLVFFFYLFGPLDDLLSCDFLADSWWGPFVKAGVFDGWLLLSATVPLAAILLPASPWWPRLPREVRRILSMGETIWLVVGAAGWAVFAWGILSYTGSAPGGGFVLMGVWILVYGALCAVPLLTGLAWQLWGDTRQRASDH